MELKVRTIPKSKLFFPIITRQIAKGGERVVGEHGISVIAPQNASQYELAIGIGKKGLFQSYLFKNDANEAVQHYTRYITDNGSVKDVLTDFNRNVLGDYKGTERKLFNSTRRTTLNGRLKEIHNASILPTINPNTGEVAFSKSFMTMTPNGDKGGLELLQEGEKAVGISCKYNYDGNPIKLKYKNTHGQSLELTDTESTYLPFIFRKYGLIDNNLTTYDFAQGKRVKQQIKLSQRIQEKLHGIEGVLPDAKVVPEKDLHIMKTSGMTVEQYHAKTGFPVAGESLPNGQINLAKEYNQDGLFILDRTAHEGQHDADLIKMYCGGTDARDEALRNIGKTLDERLAEIQHEAVDIEEFEKAVIEKFGQLKKGTPEYEESVKLWEMNLMMPAVKDFESIDQHDIQEFEKRAIDREFQQMGAFNEAKLKVCNFFTQFFKPKTA